MQRRDLRAAMPLLREVLKLCPNVVGVHLRFQDSGFELGGESEAQMRAFYAARPDELTALTPFLRSRLAPDDASRVELLDEAIKRDDQFHLAYLEYAALWRRIARTGQALKYLQLAIGCEPSSPEANLGMAEVLVKLGRAKEAEPYYANYVRLRPGDRVAKKAYLQLLIYSLDQLDRAEPLVLELLAVQSSDVEVIMDRAAIAWMRGRHAEAIEFYQDVLKRESGRARAVLNLGNLYYELAHSAEGETERAYLQKARLAYIYYQQMSQAEGFHDLVDLRLAVPFRLKDIGKRIGPAATGLKPRLGQF